MIQSIEHVAVVADHFFSELFVVFGPFYPSNTTLPGVPLGRSTVVAQVAALSFGQCLVGGVGWLGGSWLPLGLPPRTWNPESWLG